MKVYIKLLLTAMFWGGTFVAGRLVSQNIGPFSIAFLRFAMASAFLLLLTWKVEGKLVLLKKSQVLPVIVLGMTGIFLYNVMFFKGLKIVEASRASLIIATCPIFIAIFSIFFLKETINLVKALGIIISVFGAAVVISKGNLSGIFKGGFGLGEFYFFICVLCWAAYSLIGKVVMKNLSPLVLVTYSAVTGAIALFFPAFYEGLIRNIADYSYKDWLSISYLAVLGTVVGFVWYYQCVEKIGPMKAGLFINFVPVFAILFAFIILSEPVTYSLITGAILIISGVYLTNKPVKIRSV